MRLALTLVIGAILAGEWTGIPIIWFIGKVKSKDDTFLFIITEHLEVIYGFSLSWDDIQLSIRVRLWSDHLHFPSFLFTSA